MVIPAIAQYYQYSLVSYNNQIRDTYDSSNITNEAFLLTKDDIELSIKNISIDPTTCSVNHHAQYVTLNVLTIYGQSGKWC